MNNNGIDLLSSLSLDNVAIHENVMVKNKENLLKVSDSGTKMFLVTANKLKANTIHYNDVIVTHKFLHELFPP